jgi:hypothetical protein
VEKLSEMNEKRRERKVEKREKERKKDWEIAKIHKMEEVNIKENDNRNVGQ